jgi:hypothetical protein
MASLCSTSTSSPLKGGESVPVGWKQASGSRWNLITHGVASRVVFSAQSLLPNNLMPIEELIKYHQDAISYLENQQKALAEGDQLLIPVGIATDFHRRAVVVLMAAKAMFEKVEAGGPPPDKIVTL